MHDTGWPLHNYPHAPPRLQEADPAVEAGLEVGGLHFASPGAAAEHLRSVQARLLNRIVTAAHPDFAFLLGLLQRHPGCAALVRSPPVCAFTVRRSRRVRGLLEVCFADASGEVAELAVAECLQ